MRTSFGLRRRSLRRIRTKPRYSPEFSSDAAQASVGVAEKRTMYQRKVDVDMLNAVKSVLADVSSVSPPLEKRRQTFL